MTPIKTISADELKTKIEQGDSFKLVMALSEKAFNAKRIPGSIRFNTPAEAAARLDPHEAIVVYCTDAPCISSQYAYQYLVEHGFTNVRRFAGGLSEWEERGFPFEGTMVEEA